METLASLLESHEEETCPICRRPLVVTELPDGNSRFDGCGRDCLPMYWIPDGIVLGPQGGLKTIYRKKWNPNPPTTLTPRFTSGGW